MKKIWIGCFLLSSLAYGEIDLAQNSSLTTSLGYSGFSLSGNYKGFSRDSKNIGFLQDLYTNQKEEILDFSNKLETDNRDREYFLDIEYLGFSGKDYSSNGIGLSLGISKDDNSRMGIRILGNEGNIKKSIYKNNKQIGIQGFYFNEKEDFKWSIIPFLAFSSFKTNQNTKDKKVSYGAYAKFEKQLFSWSSFEYLVPSVIFDTYYRRLNHKKSKNMDRENDQSLVSSFSLQGKNEFFVDNIKLEALARMGYEYEFLEKDVYNSIKQKDKDSQKVVGEIGVGVHINEFFIAKLNTTFKKSLSTTNTESLIGVGLEMRF